VGIISIKDIYPPRCLSFLGGVVFTLYNKMKWEARIILPDFKFHRDMIGTAEKNRGLAIIANPFF